MVDGEQVILQVVFHPLGTEEINHIWSTQGDVAYRPSVAYEMALSPIVPRAPKPEKRLVGELGLEVHGDMAARSADFSGHPFFVPSVHAGTVDIDAEDWAPLICFVRNGACEQSLILELDSNELESFSPRVWIAGHLNTPVTLRWEKWGNRGWEDLEEPTVDNAFPSFLGIDPEQAAGAETVSIALPPHDGPGQWTLYAEREFTRAADGAQIRVRSNPLLVTIYKS